MFFFEKFKALQYQLNISIEESKEKYYTKLSSRLADPLTSPKTYWSILKTFLNNKKFPCLLHLFHENKFITNFNEKAELFNQFFVNQCSLLSNNSVLPTNLPQLTSKCLDSIHFSSSDIAKIISRLDPNKAHGHDMLSIRMIKLCGNSICKPLSINFKDCLSEGKFPHEWKKANVVHVHKKGNKQSLENYRPISLLPICSKIFESLIYNEMFTFFIENNSRCWFRKLCHFNKIFNDKPPSYLFNLIPYFNRVQNTRLSYNIPAIKVKHDYFKNAFFPSAISVWNKLDLNIRNSASLNAFKKKLLNFMRPCANSIFDIHNPLGTKLLTKLRLGLSPLHEHKFRHCFQDTLNPLCECAKDIESTMHFFLHCTNFLIPTQILFQKIRNIDNNILSQSETQLTQTLLYGNQNYHPSINRLIINSTIEYIISTERFKCLLFN